MEPQSVAIAGQDFGRTELFSYVLYLYQCLPREVTRGYILDSVQERALKMASPSAVTRSTHTLAKPNSGTRKYNWPPFHNPIPLRRLSFRSDQSHFSAASPPPLFPPSGLTPRIYPAANGNKLSIKNEAFR